MPIEYTRDEILEWLKKHFENCGYEVEKYSPKFHPVRVPLYGKSSNNTEDDIAIDFTLSNTISKDAFLPTKTINSVQILEAGPLAFYQYYFIHPNLSYNCILRYTR